MLDDWNITHERGDMPPPVWEFLKTRGFFAMIIPKKYGGLEFSAYAHSCVLAKIASRSATASSTVAVPNSLGPAELLNHYGTEEQKNYYLPRLARGEEVPCFALTGPRAGSDAGSIPDTGIVCRGTYQGREVLGRAAQLRQALHHARPGGDGHRAGLPPVRSGQAARRQGGRRHHLRTHPAQHPRRQHRPAPLPAQYSLPERSHPGQGRVRAAGCHHRRTEAARAAAGACWWSSSRSGRCISLPSNATGGAKAAVWATGAYARIRTQFNMPVGKFEGVEAVIARMVGLTYTIDAARSVTAGAIDGGEKPSVPSGILKYHATEMGRQVANDAMDVHGGKGICLGPNNYLGRGYQVVPVAITVEGANLLTRNLIIFGQGAIRCHPFVLREMTAAKNPDRGAGVEAFDRALFGHIGFTLSNAVRSFIMALTHARFTRAPVQGTTARYYQHVIRFSASFAFAVDVAMLTLGGYLKKKENLSARLGDVLSYMYLASMVLKHHENQGRQEEDLPIVEWACRNLLYQAQEQLHGFLRNFPNRLLAAVMRTLIFPGGLVYSAPGDRLGRKVAALVTAPSEARLRLGQFVYRTAEPSNALAHLQEALLLAVELEPLEKRIRVEGVKAGKVTALDLPGRIQQALALGLISETEAAALRDYDRKVMALIHVDDFDSQALGTQTQPAARSSVHVA